MKKFTIVTLTIGLILLLGGGGYWQYFNRQSETAVCIGLIGFILTGVSIFNWLTDLVERGSRPKPK